MRLRVVRQRAMQFEQAIKVAIPGLKCGPEDGTFGLGSKKNHFTIDCEIRASCLAEKIFTDLPKFTITSKCSEGRNKPISRERRNFFSYQPKVAIVQTLSQYLFQTKVKKCSSNGCSGSIIKTLTSSDYFLWYNIIINIFKLKTLKSNFNLKTLIWILFSYSKLKRISKYLVTCYIW